MMINDGKLFMSDSEWVAFRGFTKAPHCPRTPREFDLMCDMAIEDHRICNTDGLGELYAVSLQSMKFGPNGEVNFPADNRRDAYLKAHGTWPTDKQLAAFEGAPASPGLSLVR